MKPLFFSLLLLSACAGGTLQSDRTDPFTGRTLEPKTSIVEAHAGASEDGTAYRYVVDRLTETCWFASSFHGYGPVATDTLAAIDCCKLRRVPELTKALAFARCEAPTASAP